MAQPFVVTGSERLQGPTVLNLSLISWQLRVIERALRRGRRDTRNAKILTGKIGFGQKFDQRFDRLLMGASPEFLTAIFAKLSSAAPKFIL